MRTRCMSRRGVVWAALLLAAAGTSIWADAETDDRIRLRIENRLAGQVALSVENLKIEVQEAVVRLSGSVASIGELERVERLVSGVVGVAGTVNELTIRASTRSDLALSQEIRRLLNRRTRFRDAGIVVTASGTEVSLEGMVERALDRLDAEKIAADVAGVTRVVNKLQVASDGRIPPEVIGTRVRSLLVNPLTFGVIRELEVSVEEGVVHLRGVARRDGDRIEAERLAMSVPGVTGVINEISVLGS